MKSLSPGLPVAELFTSQQVRNQEEPDGSAGPLIFSFDG